MDIELSKIKSVMLSRVDNIGDVVLTLPLAVWFKQQNPEIKIYFLARHYVHDVVERCPYVDEFVDWSELAEKPSLEQVKYLRRLNIDVFIHVHSKSAIAKLAYKAKIPYRIGSSHRVYNWLYCNKRISFTRKNSNLHEAQLNFELLRPFGLTRLPDLTWLKSLKLLTITDKQRQVAKNTLDPNRRSLIFHPLSNGNGREWPLDNFIALAGLLDKNKYQIIVTGSKSEGERLQAVLFDKCADIENWCGKVSLAELLDLIAVVDGVVVSSTGPLHIAAACGTKVVGLFPKQKGIDIARWGPLGIRAQSLVANESCLGCTNSADCLCMQRITPKMVLAVISVWE